MGRARALARGPAVRAIRLVVPGARAGRAPDRAAAGSGQRRALALRRHQRPVAGGRVTKRPDVWMPLFIGDYLADTSHLSTERHGAYLLLIMTCWKRGGTLPADDAQLADAARLPAAAWRKHRDVVMAFFTLGPEGWTHKRVTTELERAAKNVAGRSSGGKKAAEIRWRKGAAADSSRIAERCASHTVNDAPSPSPKKDPSQEGANTNPSSPVVETLGATPRLRVVPS